MDHSVQTGPLEVKHLSQTMRIDSWNAEVWLDASIFHVGESIAVGIRLTPPQNDRTEEPKIKVFLKISQKNSGISRSIALQPTFQDCRKMPEGREVTFHDGEWGEYASFPPKGLSWQTVIKDPFKSDWRNNGKYFAVGEYLLNIEIHMNKMKYGFKTLPLVVWQRGKP